MSAKLLMISKFSSASVAEFEEVVDDIAEVFFHVLVQDGMLDRFQLAHDRDLETDDAAQGDDIGGGRARSPE